MQKEEGSAKEEVLSPALKQTLLWRLPPFLILNLKRFMQTYAKNKASTRKNARFVTFDLTLDLADVC